MPAKKVSTFNSDGTNQRATVIVGLGFRGSDGELYVADGDETTGSINVSGGGGGGSATVQYKRDSVDTPVATDSVTPANNRPLPVVPYTGEGGLPASFGAGATDAQTQRVVVANDQIVSVSGPLTDTELRASPVEVDVTASVLPPDAATETTLSNIDIVTTAIAVDADAIATSTASIDTKTPALVSGRVPVDVQAAVLPTGAATEATLAGIKTRTDITGNGAATDAMRVAAQLAWNSNAVTRTNDIPTSPVVPIRTDLFSINASGAGAEILWSSNKFASFNFMRIVFTSVGTNVIQLQLNNSSISSNYANVPLFNVATNSFQTDFTNGTFLVDMTGYDRYRFFASSYSGPASIALVAITEGISPAYQRNALLASRHEAAATPLSSRLSNGTNFLETDVGTPSAATLRTAAMLGVGSAAVSASNPVPTSQQGGAAVQLVGSTQRPYFQDFSSASLSTAYTQVVASTPAVINRFCATNNSSTAIYIATGAAASEVVQYIVMPGENAMNVPLAIPSGTRIAIRTQTGTLASGQFSFNALS